MKILISACVYGDDVRWNGSNRHHQHIHDWAEENGYELVPICPEHELFGTPRSTIRLRAVDGEVKAFDDGLMVIRKLFGTSFSGDALTDKAIASDATRTTEEIHAYIEQLASLEAPDPGPIDIMPAYGVGLGEGVGGVGFDDGLIVG